MSDPANRLWPMLHPWGILKRLSHIRVSWVAMPDGRPGRTNGIDIVWMDRRLQQVERRCTLMHELIHIELQHTSCQPSRCEDYVCAETARRLISISDLCRHAAWAHSPYELADELWVTPDVLRDRIKHLTTDELAQLAAVEHQTR